uniref:UDP-glucuronosyltransferase n=1 Tax=Gadus morhua TaxID=8049 RepID=A0A8C5B015_GADMO
PTSRCWSAKLGFLAWLCFSTLGATLGAKVLVVPVDGSQWLSMKLLVKELIVRGHDVVLLEPETTALGKGLVGCRNEIYPVSYTKEELVNVLKQLQENVFIKLPKITDAYVNVQRLIDYTSIHVKGCENLLYNQEVMGRLRLEGFDVVLTDPFLPCGSILAETLSVPVVYFLRGLPCGLDEIGTQCPSPPSYVPRFYSGHSDTMTFPQRVKNMVMYGIESVSCRIMYASFDELASRYLEKDISYKDLVRHGAIWLLRYDFAFLFPKPMMPNMVLIGGINCAKPSPLSAHLEEFVDGSGDDGFIVFTLGSMVDKMPADMTIAFLDAFKKIPQRVVWRHTGILPEDVPENVKIMKWLPQNDLLAHPKAKLFLTHGGSHGIYEGICHGVPMVMMPLFGDQPDNVDYMVARGVAVVIDVFDVTTEKVLEAINKVVNDTSYKEKMVNLMSVHQDHAVKPLDLAVFWTEFVVRHQGADHLRPAAHNLNWIQYHSLDTLCLLAAIVMTIAFLGLKCCCFCGRKCCVRVAKKKKVL